MIYFIQDETLSLVKIGYTGGDDPQSRLKALQTGNPCGLTLLYTMPGEQKLEGELHQRFAAARERGEWFRPVPALLKFILENAALAAFDQGAKAPANALFEIPAELPRLRLYLAGKIARRDWRHEIVPGLPGAWTAGCMVSDLDGHGQWPAMQRAIFGHFTYAGPYFADCGHSCNFGDDSHGLNASDETTISGHTGDHGEEVTTRFQVVERCSRAIRNSDVVFAWIDQLDCYGTVAEIGFAAALGKQIWVAGPTAYRDMWLLYAMATIGHFGETSACSALKACIREWQATLAATAKGPF